MKELTKMPMLVCLGLIILCLVSIIVVSDSHAQVVDPVATQANPQDQKVSDMMQIAYTLGVIDSRLKVLAEETKSLTTDRDNLVKRLKALQDTQTTGTAVTDLPTTSTLPAQ